MQHCVPKSRIWGWVQKLCICAKFKKGPGYEVYRFHGFQEQEDYVINRAKYLSLVNIHFDVFEPAVGNQDNTIKLRGEVQRCDLISITKGTKSDIFHV